MQGDLCAGFFASAQVVTWLCRGLGLSDNNTDNGQWSSRLIYILAVTGATVGLGNVWRFPYLVGENGGGAFILIYLVCLAVMAIPLMAAEVLIGRRGRQNPVSSYLSLAQEAGGGGIWQIIGLLSLLAGILIASYFSVIAGWAMAYAVRSASGSLEGVTALGAESIFSQLISDPERLLAWHTLFMVLVLIPVSRGLRSGLELAARFLMPLLFALLLLLLGYAWDSGGLGQGAAYLFQADFEDVSWRGVMLALNQAFFTLGLGTGAMLVYGAYLPRNVSIGNTTILVALVDTVVALLAGLVVYSMLFANSLDVGMGPGLIFEILPVAFGQMRGGAQLAALFFLFLVIASLTSVIALIEPNVRWLVERWGFDRVNATIWVGGLIWLLGLGTLLSFNHWPFSFEFAGETWTNGFFDILVILTANVILPLTGIALVLFVGWVMSRTVLMEELDMWSGVGFHLWYFLVRYVTPAAIFLIFLQAIGVVQFACC